MIEKKMTRQHLKSEPKGPSERDMQIYELQKVVMMARELGAALNYQNQGDE
jgi:hypothetical protein